MMYINELTICLGSSCFARGNKKTVQIIKNYLKENNINDRVFFHGAHCFGLCDKGPNLKIDNEMLNEITADNITSVLKEKLK